MVTKEERAAVSEGETRTVRGIHFSSQNSIQDDIQEIKTRATCTHAS